MHLRKLVQGFVTLTSWYVLGKAIGFFAVVSLSRNLPSTVLGAYATVITLVGYLQAASNWGSDALGIKAVAISQGAAWRQVGEVARARGLLGAVPLVALLIGLSIFHLSTSSQLAVVGIWLAFLVRSDWALLAQGRNRVVGAWIVVREATFAVLAFSVIRLSGRLDVALWSYAIAEGMWSAGSLLSVRALSGEGTAAAPLSSRDIAVQGLPLVITSITVLSSNKADVPILAMFRPPADVAAYWSAYNIMFAAMFVGSMWSRIVLPVMSRQAKEPTSTEEDVGLHYAVIAGALGALGSIAVGGFAAVLLHIAYAGRYDQAGVVLATLGLALPASYVSAALSSRLVAEARQVEWMRAAVSAAVVNVGLNLLLIPRIGIQGAAIATVSSECVGVLLLVACFRRLRVFRALGFSFGYLALGVVSARLIVANLDPQARPVGCLIVAIAFSACTAPLLLQWLPRTLRIRTPLRVA